MDLGNKAAPALSENPPGLRRPKTVRDKVRWIVLTIAWSQGHWPGGRLGSMERRESLAPLTRLLRSRQLRAELSPRRGKRLAERTE